MEFIWFISVKIIILKVRNKTILGIILNNLNNLIINFYLKIMFYFSLSF